MNVLSLFDGMSCGQIALTKLDIPIDNYYASEVDKYAIQVTQTNFPNTIQLGDVTKWREWDIDFSQIDLLTAGFPCQAWSVAGKAGGETDPRGALVHDLLDIWGHIKSLNPNLKFLFENVKMKREFVEYINGLFGVTPILINSSLLSAQNRERYYWTNIDDVTVPDDKGILLRDIVENGCVDRDKSFCIDANYFKGTNLKQYLTKSRRQIVYCETPLSWLDKSKSDRLLYLASIDNKSRKATSPLDEVLPVPIIPKPGSFIYTTHLKQNGKLYKDKCATLVCAGQPHVVDELEGNLRIRKLTPVECERLQTVPEGYTEGVSTSQRYKMLGNGWTVDVVAHIMKGLK
jgi:DNA-cytosine methyltransferase